MKIGFIGAGNMARALIGGLIKQGIQSSNFIVIDHSVDARNQLKKTFDIDVLDKSTNHLSECDAIILAVKPHQIKAIANEIKCHINNKIVIISIAAGISTKSLSEWFDFHPRIIRVMPNTPALIGMGMTGITAISSVNENDRALAEKILSAVGKILWCENDQKIDAITAVSGSGPAYIFYLLEALAQSQHTNDIKQNITQYFIHSLIGAANKIGFNQDESQLLAQSTFDGAYTLAKQSNESPTTLRERVTSKGGTTAAAINAFDKNELKAAIINNDIKKIQFALLEGVLAAQKRAIEMGAA